MNARDIGIALTALTGLLSRASNQIATVAVTLVATRFLSPAEFGVFALASIAITLIRTFLYSGAFEYLLKAGDARDCASECLAVNVMLTAALSALMALIAIAGRQLFAADGIAFAILALLPSNLIAAVAAWRESLLLRTAKLRLYYGLTMLAELAAMAVAIWLLFAGFRIGALIWQVYIRNTAMLILYLLVGRSIFSRSFSRARFVTVLRWSTSRYAAMTIGFGANYAADLFLGIFLSPAATGLYRASSRIVAAVADIFGQPARTFAMTLFSARAAAGQRSDTLWPAFFAITALVGWAALAGLAALAPTVVPLLLGDQWRAAAALVPILCLARAFSLFDGVATAALVAYDEQRPIFYIQCASATIGIMLIVVVAPFGLVPATIATVIGAAIGSSMLAAIAFRRLPGSARAFGIAIPDVIGVPATTILGALAGRSAAAAAGFSNGQIATVAISTGLLAWVATLLLIRRRTLAMLRLLRGDPARPGDPIALVA